MALYNYTKVNDGSQTTIERKKRNDCHVIVYCDLLRRSLVHHILWWYIQWKKYHIWSNAIHVYLLIQNVNAAKKLFFFSIQMLNNMTNSFCWKLDRSIAETFAHVWVNKLIDIEKWRENHFTFYFDSFEVVLSLHFVFVIVIIVLLPHSKTLVFVYFY